jgi:copper resistance protein D
VEFALDVFRFIHYAAALQLFGIGVFQGLMAPAGLRRHLDGSSRALAFPCAWLLLSSAIALLALMAGTMGEGWADAIDPAVLFLVLRATAFGNVWIFQLILALLLVLILSSRKQGKWLSTMVLATLALGSLGLIGHATIEVGAIGIVSRTSQVLHLLASGFWVGSLVPLLFCLRAMLASEHEASARVLLERFSGFGHVGVAIVIATGAANGWLLLRDTGLDVTSLYQQLLLAKICIVGIMILFAIVNRYVFMPAIPNGGPGLNQLRLGTIAEIVLSGGVIGLVSILGALSPS